MVLPILAGKPDPVPRQVAPGLMAYSASRFKAQALIALLFATFIESMARSCLTTRLSLNY